MNIQINEFANEVHGTAMAHGWWDDWPNFPEIVALIHSELSEALEEYRKGRAMIWYACEEEPNGNDGICNPEDEHDCLNYGKEATCKYRNPKPEGLPIELADAILRILDYCACAGIDIEEALTLKYAYNQSRPYRHGGKKC